MRSLILFLCTLLCCDGEVLEGIDLQFIPHGTIGWIQFDVRSEKFPDMVKYLEYHTSELMFFLNDQTGSTYKGIIQEIDLEGKTPGTITLTGILYPIPGSLLQQIEQGLKPKILLPITNE